MFESFRRSGTGPRFPFLGWYESEIQNALRCTRPVSRSVTPMTTSPGSTSQEKNKLDFDFAIYRDQVLPVLQHLGDVKPVLRLGINAEALAPDDNGAPLGVWAASAVAGSPADVAGIKAGDLMVDLGGIQLSRSGTMQEYCEILRTQGANATIDVTV